MKNWPEGGAQKKPQSLGPRLQWETNRDRIRRGINPYPGPRPRIIVRRKP